MKKLALFVAAGAALVTLPATAASLAALSGGNMLVIVDADARKVTRTVKIDGAADLVGIDVRPADGMLYGLNRAGWVFTIDPMTGKAAQKSKLSAMLPAGVTATVDFNPVADRLRIIGSDGTNLRANVDDGMVTTDGRLKFGEGGGMPNVVAGAYSNSMKGAKETALYDIDATMSVLLKQAPPNDGVVTPIGKLGGSVMGPVAFDIRSDGMGGNTGWLLAGGVLHRVDLATGRAESVGSIDGLPQGVTDIAILP